MEMWGLRKSIGQYIQYKDVKYFSPTNLIRWRLISSCLPHLDRKTTWGNSGQVNWTSVSATKVGNPRMSTAPWVTWDPQEESGKFLPTCKYPHIAEGG